MTDPTERDGLRFALALVTAWADEELDAWLSLVAGLDTWEEWQPAACSLAQLAHLLAERTASVEGTSARDVLQQIAALLATPDDDLRT